MREGALIQMRNVVNTQGRAMQTAILPGLRDVTINEAITRKRVDTVETRVDALELFTVMSFWQRVRWIVAGEMPETHLLKAPTSAHLEQPAKRIPQDSIEAECGCPPKADGVDAD